MALAPPAFSPRWLLVLVVTAAAWTGLTMLAVSINTGHAPTLDNLRGAAMTLLLIAGLPVALGFLGARLGYWGAQLGLGIGYALMLRSFAGPNTGGFEDLAAVAMFLVLGAIGLGVGTLVDIVRYFVRRSGASQAA